MKGLVGDILRKSIKDVGIKTDVNIDALIEVPKDIENGDFAFPCFLLAKEAKMSPHEIANKLMQEIGDKEKTFENIEVAGPYINFFLDRYLLADKLISEIEEKKDTFGFNERGAKKNLMIEFPSPNTNKPLHLGHLRNMAIGESVSKIAEANGFRVIRANLNNDRGVHICKSMLAYEKWGKGETPELKNKKSDHFVGDYYIKFSKEAKKNEKLEEEAQEMLKKWEEGDQQVVSLWEKMRKWALDGFKETYNIFGVKIDKEYFESDIYKEGKNIILRGRIKGVFKKRDDGAVIINLEDEKLGEKVLLRPDGTSIYITQDLYLAKKKFKDFDLDESIYVTGNEQEYHFNVLFSILEKLGIASKDKLKHLSYGMVLLPEGKMKSREGTVVDADDLIIKLHKMVKTGLKKRHKLNESVLEERSLKIALAALKYFLLKVDTKRNMTFNPKDSISFEGDTGPYIQYSYARASSILRKVESIPELQIPEKMEDKERELLISLNDFKETILNAYNSMNPSLISNYAFRLAKTFSEFYHECPVIDSTSKAFRLHLIDAFRQVLKNAVNLLGIDVVEEM